MTPKVQLMVASSTPAGTPVFRFHAVRSPTDQDGDLPFFYIVPSTNEAAGPSGKRFLFVLDAFTGVLSVDPNVLLQERVTRNKGNV